MNLGESEKECAAQRTDFRMLVDFRRGATISLCVGILSYVLAICVLGKSCAAVTQLAAGNFKSNILWVVPEVIFFINLLLAVLIGIFFGKRNETSGMYEYKKTDTFIIPIFKIICVIAMSTMGFLLGIIFIGTKWLF